MWSRARSWPSLLTLNFVLSFLRGLLKDRIRRDRCQTMADLTGEILSHRKYWQRYCEPNNIGLPSAHEQFVEVGGEYTVPLYIDS